MTQTEADEEPGRRITSMRVGSLLFSRGLLTMTFGSIALFLPLLRTDLDLTFSQAGALSAGSTFVYALMQIPAGYLSDRFGPRRVLVAGFGGTSVLMLALASTQTFELAVQAVFGFFRALASAPGLVLIAAWLPPNRHSTALGMTVASNFGFQMVLNLTEPTSE
jgi:MFS family permease